MVLRPKGRGGEIITNQLQYVSYTFFKPPSTPNCPRAFTLCHCFVTIYWAFFPVFPSRDTTPTPLPVSKNFLKKQTPVGVCFPVCQKKRQCGPMCPPAVFAVTYGPCQGLPLCGRWHGEAVTKGETREHRRIGKAPALLGDSLPQSLRDSSLTEGAPGEKRKACGRLDGRTRRSAPTQVLEGG